MRHQLRVNRTHNERHTLSLTITKKLMEYMWCHKLLPRQCVTHETSNTLRKKKKKNHDSSHMMLLVTSGTKLIFRTFTPAVIL